jgi:hypothetical protein
MATIRIRDWTKTQLEKIRETESHSSNDSVIKSLLKDRELAKFAGERIETTEEVSVIESSPPTDKPFDDLTVIDELSVPDNGVLFLWCPNCATEIAHLTVEGQMSVSVFEMECQHCLSNLDHHAIVAIEIGYPIEQKLTAEDLDADLRACVIDYWDRTLRERTESVSDETTGVEQLVWQLGEYAKEFAWEWPDDVPVVGFEVGNTYRNSTTDERIEVLDQVTGNKNSLDSFEVKRYTTDIDPVDVASEIMDSSTIVDLIATRSLLLEGQSDSSTVTRQHSERVR